MSGLDVFSSALAERVNRSIAEHPMDADVLDVVDRALALDAEAVPAGLRASIPEPIHDAAQEDIARDLELFTQAYAAKAERAVDERRMSPIPSPPNTPSPRRWWPIAVVGGLLAAAAAVVVFQFGGLSTAARDDRAGGVEASHVQAENTDTEAFEGRVPAPANASSQVPTPELEAPPEPEPEPEAEPEPEPEPAVRKDPKISLDGLEARAHARWNAGQLAGAEEDLRAIIRRSGRTRRAELAYGDLFAVAFQRNGERARTRVWKQYLRKFPKGRFADDVEAGLCRRARVERGSSCWKTYLQHHPEGAHRSEATRGAQ